MPLVHQTETDAVLLIDKIAVVLKEKRDVYSSFGYTKGLLGNAVFLFHYAQFKNLPEYAQVAETFITESVVRLNETISKSEKFVKDFAELGMFLEYAQLKEWIDFDFSDVSEYIDSYLIAFAKNRLSLGDFDPYTGGLLAGHYFLHRSDDVMRINITVIINSLEILAVSDEKDGLYWKSKLFDDDRIYLGLSHGLAVIIVFLCKAYENDIEVEKCKKMIAGAVNYIFSHQQDITQKGCFFPDIIGQPDKGRLGLCYGDMGVIYALFRAGTILESKAIQLKATELMLQTTTRKTSDTNGIKDAGILYGASGVALIYDKMYRLTNNYIFFESAKEWFDTISLYRKESPKDDGTLGFEGYFNQHFSNTNYSFMEGIAGIGTTLMKAIDKNMAFDKLIWLY